MDVLLDPQNWVALATLAALEIVLGIDNVIFISILASRLPAEQRDRARRIGLGAAMLSRLVLLFSLAWVIGLTQPLFTALGQEISGRDLVLLAGGLFLMAKSTGEIHGTLEGEGEEAADSAPRKPPSFAGVIVQIMLLDIVFSLDSVITAVGMVDEVAIMATAVVLATVVMVSFSGPVSGFVSRHPTVKMLALSFLILIGVALVAEGLGLHIPKGYIYFAMAFSVGVEMLNLSLFRRRALRSKPR
ncbi:TerC family protein [Aquabacterium sp. A7-Y]|uniref:TerC family protein n=1 Tax=Aquabacterium sp. A7-Y TaxID=1349605 RepID=UPI00223CD565|nr:TerC family protein [Aquabacterium sp. A7-Y]MCW7538889.1 TerC family protein [Aquabacterium sp. A7-Y]